MKRKIIIVSCVIAVLAAAFIYLRIIPQITSDQRVIPRSYAHISLPQYLQFKTKQWDDRNALDPVIKSTWNYYYTVNSDKTNAQVRDDIKNSLQKQGYGYHTDYDASSPDQYFFVSKGKGLDLTIYIGITEDKNINLSDRNVLITAERLE